MIKDHNKAAFIENAGPDNAVLSGSPVTLATPSADAGSPSNPARIRLTYLDGLRGLAAFFVVVHHAYAQVYAQLSLPVIHATQWLIYAQAAVDVFIVLSGYCLMLPVARCPERILPGGNWKFYMRRARRILPPYYAALAFSLLLILLVPGMGKPSGVAWDSSLPAFTPTILLTHLFLVHCFSSVSSFKIDYPMWTVSVEWNIYLLFPILLVPVWSRYGIGPMMSVAFGLALLAHLLHHEIYVQTSWLLGLFAMGMAGAAISFDTRPRESAWRTRISWGVIAGFLWLVFWTTAQLRESLLAHHMWQTDMVVGLAATSLIIFCTRALTDSPSSPSPVILRMLEAKWAVSLGAFSYSLYLIHVPLLSLLDLWLRRYPINPLSMLMILEMIGVPACLLIAYGFHCLFERPFLRDHKRR